MMAEVVEARLPVPQVPWNYRLATRKDAAFVVGAIQMVDRQVEDLRRQHGIEIGKLARLSAFWRTHYGAAIEAVVKAELVAAGGKSITLNTGVGPKPTRAGYRKAPAKLDVTDEDAALAWAKENMPEAVKVKESVLKTPLKNHVEATSEVPPGCEYHPGGQDTFYVQGMKLKEQADV